MQNTIQHCVYCFADPTSLSIIQQYLKTFVCGQMAAGW